MNSKLSILYIIFASLAVVGIIVFSIFLFKEDGKKAKKEKKIKAKKVKTDSQGFLSSPNVQGILSSLISIGIGLLVGLVFLIFAGIFSSKTTIGDSFLGFLYILGGPLGSANLSNAIGDMIFFAVPIIFTGLSVAIAQKSGLFNIGASGQFLMACIGALTVALNINTNGNRFLGILVWLLAIVVGTLLAAIWGMIPGILKAVFGINEVIVCIMTNWIAAQITTWSFKAQDSLIDRSFGQSGAYLFKTSHTGNYTPNLGLNNIFKGSYIDIGIFVAIAIAILLWYILEKTTLGYELKACGSNKNAAKYAGMNEKKNIILSMAIAGALAGLGACFYYLNHDIQFQYVSVYQSLPNEGFNGIPVALLASNSPIGVIFTGILIRYLSTGGSNLSSAGFNKYFADIIISIIIYLAGFFNLFRGLIAKRLIKQGGKQ